MTLMPSTNDTSVTESVFSNFQLAANIMQSKDKIAKKHPRDSIYYIQYTKFHFGMSPHNGLSHTKFFYLVL